jgi:DNA-binding FrmR family transcriptional regulator
MHFFDWSPVGHLKALEKRSDENRRLREVLASLRAVAAEALALGALNE